VALVAYLSARMIVSPPKSNQRLWKSESRYGYAKSTTMFALKLERKSRCGARTNRSKTVSSELVESRLADPRGICASMEKWSCVPECS
jgi:hypothetical protein